MNFVNYTPHRVTVLTKDGQVLAHIESSGEARCEQIDGIPAHTRLGDLEETVEIKFRQYGEVTGLPPKEKGTLVIVSALVAQQEIGRTDLIWPGDVKREGGNIVGCFNFCSISPMPGY